MAKAFSTIKSSDLGWEDKLTIGKFKNCRICDIATEEYEYLIWLEKEGFVKYNKYLTDRLKQIAGFELEKVHYEQEIRPWVAEDWDDDIPF